MAAKLNLLTAAILAALAHSGSLSPTYTADLTTGSLPSGMAFTRASTSTAIVSGALTTVTSGTPAFESWGGVPRGLRVCGAAANLLTFSNVFSNAAWAKSTGTISTGADNGPDGSTAMAQFLEGTTSGYQAVSQTLGSTASGVTQTFSVFVKRPTACTRFAVMLRMAPQFNNNGFRAIFRYDGTTGYYGLTDSNVTIVSQKFIPIANGIYLLSITGTWLTTSSKTFAIHSLDETQTTIQNPYAGSTTQGPELWGAQVSTGAGLAAYCDNPTTATGTVAAESAIIASPTWLDTTKGTFIITHDCQSGVLIGSGTNAIVTATSSVMPGTGTKTAFAWDSGGSDFLNNGQATTAGGVPTFGSDIRLLATSAVANFGHIRRIDYYPSRLTVTQMQTLTSPLSTAAPGSWRIATRARMPTAMDVTGGTSTQLSFISRCDAPILGGGYSKLRAKIPNFAFPGTAANTSAVVIDACYLERSGTHAESVQVKFGGSGTTTMSSGQTEAVSDDILPTSFTGISSFLPDNVSSDTYWWRVIGHVASTSATFPTSRWSQEVGKVEVFGYDSGAVTPPAASGTGALGTFAGAHTTPSRALCPILLGIPLTGDPISAFCVGDSIIEGVGGYTGRTWLEDACVANNVPILTLCKGGQSQTQIYNTTLWKPYLAFARVLFDNMGTNDSNHLLYFFDYWQLAKNTYSYDKLVHVGLLPRSTSTDSFATTANQTVVIASTSDIYQMLASAALTGQIDIQHPMTSVRDGTTYDKWAANGATFAWTVDGTHPFTVLAEPAMATEAAAILTALRLT
jgi:hypothetical protein